MTDLQAAIERVRGYAHNIERGFPASHSRTNGEVADDLRAIVGALEEAREVVEPFADAAEGIVSDSKGEWNPTKWIEDQKLLTVGQFRAARTFLAKLGDRP